MARIINGRLLPTFLLASPIKEVNPTREESMVKLLQTQEIIKHILQQFNASRQSKS
jgi:hypothetical protein